MASRVLVIEDEENILLSLTFVLEHEGYEVRSARTGQEGLAAIYTDPPDLVILDLMLPDVSGYEVCRQIRQQAGTDRLPILVLTARAQETERQRGLAVGATEYVTKPFRVADLLDRVARQLGPPESDSRRGGAVMVDPRASPRDQ